MTTNFKVYEKITQYHQLYMKFNKLNHQIDSKINNDADNITTENITNVIEDYDQMLESMEYSFPIRIKNKIKNNIRTNYPYHPR